MITVLVCGGRDFGHTQDEHYYIYKHLDLFCIEHSEFYNPNDNWLPSDIKIIAGAAKGVDTAAIDWAVVNWCEFQEFPADWATHGKAAGTIRNKQMLEEGKPDYVIAFQGGRGTAHMVKIAKEAGVPVIEIPPYERQQTA